MEILLGIVALYLLYSSGALANVLPSLAPPVVAAPAAIKSAPTVTAAQLGQTDTAIASGTIQGSVAAASYGLNQLGASSSALQAVPVVGAAVGLIAGVLIAASKKRAQEATSENSAVAAAVPGWDAAIASIVANYNAGAIDASGVQQLLQTALSNYWQECSAQIQPGRNGCNSGANCPPVTGAVSANSTNEGGNNYCSGNIGAACCVGCADLNLSTSNMNYAVNQAQQSGKSISAFVQVVYASKYGGVNRPAYAVTFTPLVQSIPA